MLTEFPDLAWRRTSVSDEPAVQIQHWDIKKDIAGDCYFIGDRVDDGWSRVSTPIVQFNAEAGSGRTQSGRIYELHGPRGASRESELAWALHKIATGIVEPESEQ